MKLVDSEDMLPMSAILAKVGVPPRYRTCSRDSWKGHFPIGVADWIAKPENVLTLWGETGTGKTHLATTALAEVAQATYQRFDPDGCGPGLWISAADMLEKLRSEMRGSGGATMATLLRTPILLLDDLGAESLEGDKGDWRRERVSFLLSQRYDWLKPSIVTTNLKPQEIAAYDARLASRILSGELFDTRGDDKRFK